MRKHILPEKELTFPRTLHEDRHKLEKVQVPIITVSASYRSDIAKRLHEKARHHGEIVFSRAHYSMAVAVYEEAICQNKTAWMVDPINYLSEEEWQKLARIKFLGQLTARIPILKTLKDIFDTLIRRQIPLTAAIEKPLAYVTSRVGSPIISLHYEAGNYLAKIGKRVLQVVTDPHVRPHYLFEAERDNITFAVFDEATKKTFFEKAQVLGKKLPGNKVIVCGPPVDARIVEVRGGKTAEGHKNRPLRLAVTTSGLGTNFGEIKKLLANLIPEVKAGKVELLLYASTHEDFKAMYDQLAHENNLPVGDENAQAPVRVIWDESIVEANQKLIDYAFGWADGFITKPSGDMAYDALAAGCFLLTLSPWGEWEENIFDIFSRMGIAKKAEVENIREQLENLERENWFSRAISNALEIDEIFLNGAKNIVDLQQKISNREL